MDSDVLSFVRALIEVALLAGWIYAWRAALKWKDAAHNWERAAKNWQGTAEKWQAVAQGKPIPLQAMRPEWDLDS